MLFEHLIYSTAIAIIAGMIWYKRTGRDFSWIIMSSAFAPDFDIVAGELFRKLDMNILIDGTPIRHGDSFLFAGVGFRAHMFEDALIANRAYRSCWSMIGTKGWLYSV